jgi:hypothetical protein
MNTAARFRLNFGPYRPPRCRLGSIVKDLIRGPVRIVGMTDARIPWPIGKVGRGKSLLFAGGLAKAVRKESHQAVRHWWGVCGDRVWKWRKALGVPRTNDGTYRLRVHYGREPFFKRAQRKAWSKARDPERCAKIAAARRGKPRPPEIVAKMNRLGSRHSKSTRRKMSLAHQKQWTQGPLAERRWTPREDEWLRTLPAAEVAKQTGRTLKAVWSRRRILGLPDGRANRRLPMTMAGRWAPEDDELVRRLKAGEAARRTGRTLTAVYTRRSILKSLGRVNKTQRSAKMSRGG